jgi:hypothetical protein
MADLIDRLSGESLQLATPRPKINLHRWIAAQRLYAFGEWTGAEIATEFDLQGNEATQATTIKNNIDAQTGASNKALYILRVESVAMCIEDNDDGLYHDAQGMVDKTKVAEDIQI